MCQSEANMKIEDYPDVIQTILARPRNGNGGGIPLTRGEVAMLFLDGYAGDDPTLLDIRSQGYGEDTHFDDQKGHILLPNQPLSICDKTAAALAALGRDDIFISESTYFYSGGGGC